MARGKYIKPEQVEAVKALDKAKHGIKTKAIANMLGISESSVQAIRRGEYDHMFRKAIKEQIIYLHHVVEKLEKECQ